MWGAEEEEKEGTQGRGVGGARTSKTENGERLKLNVQSYWKVGGQGRGEKRGSWRQRITRVRKKMQRSEKGTGTKRRQIDK